MKLTILVDNHAKEGLESEHGFSVLIETSGKRILFDTGKGKALKANTDILGISLADLDAVVLSHGHYDHTGGLPYVLDAHHCVPLYCHTDVLTARFTVRNNEARPISMVPSVKEAMDALPNDRVHWVTEPFMLFPGIWLTGPIPRTNTFEDTGGPFYKDIHGTIADPINDDLALFVETAYGIVVIAGCAHSGIINTLTHVQNIVTTERIRAIVGGFHLLEARKERLSETISNLRALSLNRIVPCHCTGAEQARLLKDAFGGTVTEGRAGEVFRF